MPSYILLTCIVFSAMIAMAEETFARQVYLQPDKSESSLWIEGRSNVSDFECTSEKYTGSASVYSANSLETEGNHLQGHISIEIRIQVDGFECGRNRMNRDLQNALKADEHPEIIFRFASAEIIDSPARPESPYILYVNGALTAAGETREIGFEAQGYYMDGYRMRATGNSVIKMTDFNIEPPTALLGLVQADDQLTVNFDLVTTSLSEQTK